MMEAAASGTAPTMELDTSSFASEPPMTSASGGAASSADLDSNASLRSRNQQQVEQDLARLSPRSRERARKESVGNLFGARPESHRASVNLMDHDTGIYEERKSFSQKLSVGVGMLSSLFSISPSVSEFDASGLSADDYIGGDAPGDKRGRRVSPWSAMLRNKYFLAVVLVVTAGVLVTTTVILGKPQSQIIHQKNELRHEEIYNKIVLEGVSKIETLHDELAPQFHALRWISFTDPMHLEPDDDMILERYALAVLYYGSYFAFERQTGKQPITDPDNDQYEGVPNPGWIRKDRWMSGHGHCQWYGVECKTNYEKAKNDNEDDHSMHYDDNAPIVSIDMRNNNVLGTLPMELKVMDEMVFLDLAHNKLSGTIPWQVSRMFELKHVLLNDNAMTGTLPTFMGQMEDIKELRLGNNHFSGTIPTEMYHLWDLQHLSLENNKMTGPLPDLSKCKRLHTLWLDNNDLTGTIPHHFGDLIEMKELHLHNNNITGRFPSELGKLIFLEKIVADSNELKGPLDPRLFDKLTNLKHLSLEHNQLTGTLPFHIGLLKKLEVLELNNNQFTGVMPDWFHMESIQTIHLHENKLDFTIPTSVGRMLKLTELWLHKNGLDRKIPSELGHCSNLESLYLEYNELTGTVPTELGKLESLKDLRVFGNNFEGKFPAAICDLRQHHSLVAIEATCVTTPGAAPVDVDGQDEDGTESLPPVLECHCCTCVVPSEHSW